jgi:ADP-ribose pyrophosphatase YjhB (NUDIX family)
MIVEQAGGIVLLDGRLVVRRTASGDWVLPKGHIEPGETAEQTAIREIAEETGLETTALEPTSVIEFMQQGEMRRVTFFILRPVGKLPTWNEHLGSDTYLVEPGDANRLFSFSSTRQVWESAKDRVLELANS